MAAGPAAELLAYRGLIWNFAARDLKARFKGTVLGWAWSLVVPLATLLIYTVVFSVIFRAQPPAFGSGRVGIFAIWLLAGLVPWMMLANAINTSMPSLLATGPLLKKIYFPPFAPILGTTAAILIQSSIELGILLVILAILQNASITWLLLIPWAVIFVAFIGGLCIALSIINIYFRDLAHIIGVVLQILFYLSPIIYTVDFIPVQWHGLPLRALIEANPVTLFVELFRDIVYGLSAGSLSNWLYCLLLAVVSVAWGVLVHRSRGRDLSEEL